MQAMSNIALEVTTILYQVETSFETVCMNHIRTYCKGWDPIKPSNATNNVVTDRFKVAFLWWLISSEPRLIQYSDINKKYNARNHVRFRSSDGIGDIYTQYLVSKKIQQFYSFDILK